jgi:hypothetical protein
MTEGFSMPDGPYAQSNAEPLWEKNLRIRRRTSTRCGSTIVGVYRLTVYFTVSAKERSLGSLLEKGGTVAPSRWRRFAASARQRLRDWGVGNAEEERVLCALEGRLSIADDSSLRQRCEELRPSPTEDE